MKANELRIGNLVNKSLKSGNGRSIEAQIGCQDIVKIFETCVINPSLLYLSKPPNIYSDEAIYALQSTYGFLKLFKRRL